MNVAEPLVFRDYSQSALDAQYNNRARVPDAPAILADWARRGAETRSRRASLRDVAYAADPRQAYDLYRPALDAGAPPPCLVFIHGGYWQALTKVDCAFLADAYLDRGIAVAMIDYRLCPHVSMADVVADTQQSIAHIARNAEAHAIDVERIFVAGHSAGGHLTAMMAATDWTAFGLSSDMIKGACAISGLYDLEPIEKCYLNGVLRMSADEARRLSPVRAKPLQSTPLLLTVGGDEPAEYQRQQTDLRDAWRARGASVWEVAQQGGHHFRAVEVFGEPDHPLFAAMCGLIDTE